MNKKKICMAGASGVGKTCLVQRFIRGSFTETSSAPAGITIEQRQGLVIWDIDSEEAFHNVYMPYLRGAAGYLLVVDGTRQQTLNAALLLQELIHSIIKEAPFVLVFSKSDRHDAWEIGTDHMTYLSQQGYPIALTSARTGQGVTEAFSTLAQAIDNRGHEIRKTR